MKTNKTTAKSTQLSPNTKSAQAIKSTNHTKAIERIEYLKSCIENLKNTKPSERKTNEFDKGIQNARKEVDNALESLIKAFEIPKNLNDKLEKIDSEINHFWEKTMPQKVPQEQYEILQVPNDEGRLVKKWHKVLEKPQAKSIYTQEYVDRIFRAIDEFYEFVDSHLLDKERFMERINLEVNELKKRIEKIMQQDSIERWFFPYFWYRNIFDIDTQALKKCKPR